MCSRVVLGPSGGGQRTFEAIDRSIAGDTYRYRGTSRLLAERYGKKYSWIGFFTYAGLLEEPRVAFPRVGAAFYRASTSIPHSLTSHLSMVSGDVLSTWLSPDWLTAMRLWVLRPIQLRSLASILVRDKIGEHDGPWILAHGFLKAEDMLLGRRGLGVYLCDGD
jgi:hypothetical protein